MESALRHEVGSASMNDVLTEGRAVLGLAVKERLQSYICLLYTSDAADE